MIKKEDNLVRFDELFAGDRFLFQDRLMQKLGYDLMANSFDVESSEVKSINLDCYVVALQNAKGMEL